MSGMAIVALLAVKVMDYARHQHAGTDFTIAEYFNDFGGSASLAVKDSWRIVLVIPLII